MSQPIIFEGQKVLLVEDEIFLAEKICQQLSALGVKEVLTAVNLSEAEQHADSEQIDLALLDVNLPNGETSVELGARLSSEEIPVVFFSGYTSKEFSEIAKEHEFIEKSLSLPRLKASLQRAILRTSSRRRAVGEKMAGHGARQSG